MFSRKKREFPFYSTETGGTEQMYEMWSDYSLTNIANQVMNLLPFALTQQQQNIKTPQYNSTHSLHLCIAVRRGNIIRYN